MIFILNPVNNFTYNSDSGKVHIKDTTLDGKLFKIIRPIGYGKDKNN
jgi:hypothetical protein